MKSTKKKGFTIVELVIVIAVIGILSAILIPTFVGVTQAAQEASLRSNVANAYSMYAADAADGKVDGSNPEVKLKFYAQTDIVLSATQKQDNGALAGCYSFDTTDGWKIKENQKVDITIDTGATPAANTYKYVGGSYNGYYVYAKNSATAA